LVEKYYNSVGHNTTLILGVTPDSNGLMPSPDVKRLESFGREIKRRFSNPLAVTSGSGNKISLNLSKRQNLNQIVLMEDIAKGERIRQFTIEAKTEKGWETIFVGSCIGHKFIHRFEKTQATSIRIKILESKGTPQILEFSAFYVQAN
jgi:alpha-L-fucosidase